LLREKLPALRLLDAARGAGFAAGARVARGRTLLLWEPARASALIGPLAWARARVDGGAADLVVVPGCYVVCRRTRAWRALARARAPGGDCERRLTRRAGRQGLRVAAPAAATPVAGWRPFVRFVSLLRSRA